MASKSDSFVVLITLSVLLLLSVETKAQIAPSPTAQAEAVIDKTFITMLPKLEQVLAALQKHAATVPANSPNKQCLENCTGTLEKSVEDLKKFVATEAGNNALPGAFESFSGPEMEACHTCLKDASTTDPEILKIMNGFDETSAQAGDEVNKQMS